MSEEEIDPESLREDLDQIKTAMGLKERYPGQGRIWLAYGGLVGGFSLVLQLPFAFPVSNWVNPVTWVAFVLLGLGSRWILGRRTPAAADPPTAPGWLPIVAGLIAFLFVLSAISSTVIQGASVSGLLQGAYFFAVAIAAGGLGVVVVGNALAGHRIRRRDRLEFYAGGAWMLAVAASFPNSEWLRYFGYGTFGVLTIVHAVASYWLVTRE